MEFMKLATLGILMTMLVCGTFAAPVKRETQDDCPELDKDSLKLIKILALHGK